MTDSEFLKRALIVFAIGVGIVAAWALGRLLLLAFGAIVIAIMIRAGGETLAEFVPRLSARWGSVVVLVVIGLLLAGMFMMVGEEVGTQVRELQRRLPEAFAKARAWLQDNPIAAMLLPQMNGEAEGSGVSAEGAAKTVSVTFTALSHAVVVLLISIYLSFSPGTYVRGAVLLAPREHRKTVGEALDLSARALRRWLLGQFVSMLLVGTLVGVGLWLIGVPLALALGILAGVLEFIPVAGPFLAAIPGILLAFSVSPTVALYALGVYLIVQQLESGIISPLAQRWAVHLPPAIGLFAIVVLGLLFGVPGILFATPLTVVVMVMVQKYWVDGDAVSKQLKERSA